MLYWICPECGHECSPAIRECPTCTAPPVQPTAPKPVPATSTSQGLLSLAQNFQSPPAPALLTPAPQRQLLAAATAVLVEEEPKEPELSEELAPLDNPVFKAVRPVQSQTLQVPPAPVALRLSSPTALPVAVLTPAQSWLAAAGPTPPGKITFQPASKGNANQGNGTIEQTAEPLPSRRQSVAFVRAELPVAHHSGMCLADLAQLSEPRFKPVVPPKNGHPKNGSLTGLAYKPNAPSLVSSRVKVTGDSLADLLNVLRISADQIDREAIGAIALSFREQPPVSLLCAPAEIVTAPAPPATQWLGPLKPQFTAKPPEDKIHAAAIAGPKAPPLAGPSLPPQLLNFLSASSRRHRRRTASWPINLLVAAIVILGAVSLYQFLSQDRDTRTASAATPAQSIKVVPAHTVHVVEEHPAARSVEVAGIRIVTNVNKRPQLQFIVINHSSNELMGLNIRIAVRSVENPSDAPLFSVSSIVAMLGPNQSKEIRTELDPSIQPSSIPDWQSLRTDVLVARQ
jgi:hypothetical protein